jgi:hypothetical protein
VRHMPGTVVLWPMAALLGAAGLHAIAPRRAPFLYLAPAALTTALLAAATLYVALIWSH